MNREELVAALLAERFGPLQAVVREADPVTDRRRRVLLDALEPEPPRVPERKLLAAIRRLERDAS